MVPAQSWGEDVYCHYDCNIDLPVEQDTTFDSDGDGFRDRFECCAAEGKALYYDGTPIEGDLFNPDIPNLFVVVTLGDNALLPADQNVLDYVKADPTWMRVHEIEEGKVGTLYRISNEPLPEGYRQVSKGSKQRVVRLHLSSVVRMTAVRYLQT